MLIFMAQKYLFSVQSSTYVKHFADFFTVQNILETSPVKGGYPIPGEAEK